MKIKKFNENNKFIRVDKQVVADFTQNSEQPDFHVYDTAEQVFDFLLNKIYEFYKEYELDLSVLDEINDPVELIEEYERQTYEFKMTQEIFYSPVLSEELVDIKDWIKERRDAKKYNL